MNAPFRPALRYLGGKWLLAPWIVGHFPPHESYLEPFGGGASVLLRKPRTKTEIYNDLDGEVVNYFRVMRDPALASALRELVRLTPFARAEFDAAFDAQVDDAVERARRLLVRSFMSHGTVAPSAPRSTGFRADSRGSNAPASRDWANLPMGLEAITGRLQGVVIENRPALEVIDRFDRRDTLIYADPPYPHSTRTKKRRRGEISTAYRYEMTDADHLALLQVLLSTKGMVVLSGYACALYDDALGGWLRIEKPALADGALARTEVIWINPAAVDASRGLFWGVA